MARDQVNCCSHCVLQQLNRTVGHLGRRRQIIRGRELWFYE